jgi:hypothetical protein
MGNEWQELLSHHREMSIELSEGDNAAVAAISGCVWFEPCGWNVGAKHHSSIAVWLPWPSLKHPGTESEAHGHHWVF